MNSLKETRQKRIILRSTKLKKLRPLDRGERHRLIQRQEEEKVINF